MKKKKQHSAKQKEEVQEISKPKTTRRDFMKTAWKGLGVIAGLELAGLTIHYLSSSAGKEYNTNNIFDAGLVDEFPTGTVTPFRRGHFYLARLNDGGFIALSVKCSHLGCSILWDEKENKFICPCHSSSFNISGDVINPPAPRALDIYQIKIEHGLVKVNLSKKNKRGNFEKSQLTYV